MERDELRILINSLQRGGGFLEGGFFIPRKAIAETKAVKILRREVER